MGLLVAAWILGLPVVLVAIAVVWSMTAGGDAPQLQHVRVNLLAVALLLLGPSLLFVVSWIVARRRGGGR